MVSVVVSVVCVVVAVVAVVVCVRVVYTLKKHRVSTQHVPVYAGNTRTCVPTCAPVASIHENVSNVHTWTF